MTFVSLCDNILLALCAHCAGEGAFKVGPQNLGGLDHVRLSNDNNNLPYYPVFICMHLYKKHPIFQSDQMVSYKCMYQIIWHCVHAPIYVA